ncbi:putative C2 domain-containing protein-like [Capsicum annuum]|nr:putative C2 domain-containing protein-like [Capsicum annuum]
MSEEGKDRHHHHYHHHHYHHETSQPPLPSVADEYGTFQALSKPAVIGFPQPVPPPGALEPAEYYARGYQSVPVYVADEKGAVSEPPLPCCGIGLGWFLHVSCCVSYLVLGQASLIISELGVLELDHLCIPPAKRIIRFIIGFFLPAIPWYVAAFTLLCARSVDHREKPGYVACSIAAVLATIGIIFDWTMMLSGRW